jgi:uncharacterized YccA/Bax inhibitor family protein
MLSPLEHLNEFSPGQFYSKNSDPDARTMSVGGTISKTLVCLAVLAASVYYAWQTAAGGDVLRAVTIMIIAGVLTLLFGAIIWLASIKNPVMVLLFSVFEGGFVGSAAGFLDRVYPGIALVGLLVSAAIFAVMLTGYGLRIFQVTMSGVDMFLRAFLLYLLVAGLGVGLTFSGLLPPIVAGPALLILFAILSIIAFWMASYNLLIEFDYIETGVDNGLEPGYEWLAAFSLVGALVWFYIEILEFVWRFFGWIFRPVADLFSW